MSVQFWGQLVCCIPEDACDSTCSLQSRAKNIACIGISSQHLKRVNSTEVQRLWLNHQSPQLNNNLKTPTYYNLFMQYSVLSYMESSFEDSRSTTFNGRQKKSFSVK